MFLLLENMFLKNVDFRPSFMIEIGNYVCFHHRGKNLGIKLPIPRWKIYIISYILIDMWSEIKCHFMPFTVQAVLIKFVQSIYNWKKIGSAFIN